MPGSGGPIRKLFIPEAASRMLAVGLKVPRWFAPQINPIWNVLVACGCEPADQRHHIMTRLRSLPPAALELSGVVTSHASTYGQLHKSTVSGALPVWLVRLLMCSFIVVWR